MMAEEKWSDDPKDFPDCIEVKNKSIGILRRLFRMLWLPIGYVLFGRFKL